MLVAAPLARVTHPLWGVKAKPNITFECNPSGNSERTSEYKIDLDFDTNHRAVTPVVAPRRAVVQSCRP